MLLPMGAMNAGLMEESEPPPEIREKHCLFWRLLLVLFVGLFVLQILAVDIFGCIFTGIMAAIVWYMVSNRCLQMTQYCLFMFGILCIIQALFETINLLMMVGGRRTSHTTASTVAGSGRSTSVTYTTVIETHNFFDPSQGFKYNAQSAMRVCSPAVMILSVLLAYWSYNAFPSGLFSYREEEVGPIYGGGGSGGGRPLGGAYYGGQGQQLGGGSGNGHRLQSEGGGRAVSGRPQGGGGPRLFEGSGQRLGGK
mmetsp:Transcript_77822/g.241128  ORF Transcript_77822/g.241128 Transcript_77822/m.241128 type:complete len:253 (-) Transcript_77822:164-922(-)